MLEARQVSIKIAGKYLVHKVDLSIKPGEFFCLLGNNGAGKSTLLKAISGELPLYDGSVYLNGRNMRAFEGQALARARAVLPQSVELAFQFEAGDIVRLGRFPYGAFKAHDEQFSQQSMRSCQCDHLQQQAYPQLSGGEKQRVQLARVFNQTINDQPGPGYLLVDECTASLDLRHQQHIFSQLQQKAREQNMGVLAVVHDINLAARYADRLGFMREGRLVAVGTQAELLSEALIYDIYGVETMVFNHPTQDYPMVLPV